MPIQAGEVKQPLAEEIPAVQRGTWLGLLEQINEALDLFWVRLY